MAGHNKNGNNKSEAPKMHPFFAAAKVREPVASVTQPARPDSSSPESDHACDQPAATQAQDAEPSHNGASPVDQNKEDGNQPRRSGRKRRRTRSTDATAPQSRRGRKNLQPIVLLSGTIAEHFGQRSRLANDVCHDDDRSAVTRDSGKCMEPDSSIEGTEASGVTGDLEPLGPAAQSTVNADRSSMSESVSTQSKPAKILKFDPKTGTIGSPPKSKTRPPLVADDKASSPSLTRSRRSRRLVSRVVHVQHGNDGESKESSAHGIDDVSSEMRSDHQRNKVSSSPSGCEEAKASSGIPAPRRSKRSSARSKHVARATHPFFSTREDMPNSSTGDQPEAREKARPLVKRHTIFTSTPCSPRRNRNKMAGPNLPHFGVKPVGLKVPGATHPAWPWQGTSHVHGDERDSRLDRRQEDGGSKIRMTERKAKGQPSYIAAKSSILDHAASDLGLDHLVEELNMLNTDGFPPPPPILRVPGRSFESGKKLQARVSSQLSTSHPCPRTNAHPAVINAYRSLPSSLSAFDQSTCEEVAWAQKYAPTSAAQVLQKGREAEMLRDWLQALTVQCVDTGATDSIVNKPQSSTRAKKKRKRRKQDFVVSSDEEDADMEEMSEDAADWTPDGSQGGPKKTVVRSGCTKSSRDGGRLTNAVVLSGPHGCGKTATVFAIAKELDFEVFEIGPGSRRNGKDVLDKIGDMTRNHLIHHAQDDTSPSKAVEEEVVAEDDGGASRDLKSGKQGMMTAFFKPKAAQPKAEPRKRGRPTASEKAQKRQGRAAKAQKQCLILLEEVDILFKEDQQFWATVISLMSQSRRPFIMTCNDENLVPLQSLNLHGIFRFSSPPAEVAVDLLLLIAANEGHALDREAVQMLYQSRGLDLRASITELNYWCQFGIGDPRRGVGWFHPRWPAGVDLDEQGDMIRVISTNTYMKGMGWLGRDTLVDDASHRTGEEEAMEQLWEHWGLDAGGVDLHPDLKSCVNGASRPDCARTDRLAILERFGEYTEAMSAMDVCSGASAHRLHDALVDATLPDMAAKYKDDFVVGRQLLDAPLQTSYGTTSLQVATSLKLLSRARLSRVEESCPLGEPECWDESKALHQIHRSFDRPPYSAPTTSRADYSNAFDALAASGRFPTQQSGSLEQSVFDGSMEAIALDVAPYIRSIVAYDQRLERERLRRGNLVSAGGRPRKRLRTTRSAYSALEGGSRQSTRGARYFKADLNPHLVMGTGGDGWDALIAEPTGQAASGSVRGGAAQTVDGDGQGEKEMV